MERRLSPTRRRKAQHRVTGQQISMGSFDVVRDHAQSLPALPFTDIRKFPIDPDNGRARIHIRVSAMIRQLPGK